MTTDYDSNFWNYPIAKVIEYRITNGLGYRERRQKTSNLFKRIGTQEALQSYLEYLGMCKDLEDFFSKIAPGFDLESVLLDSFSVI